MPIALSIAGLFFLWGWLYPVQFSYGAVSDLFQFSAMFVTRCIVFAAFAFSGAVGRSLVNDQKFVFAATACSIAGAAVFVLTEGPIGRIVGIVALTIGSTILIFAWIIQTSQHVKQRNPNAFLIVVAVSIAFSLLFGIILDQMPSAISTVSLFAMPLASTACYVAATHSSAASAALTSPPKHATLSIAKSQWKLFILFAVYSVMYGVYLHLQSTIPAFVETRIYFSEGMLVILCVMAAYGCIASKLIDIVSLLKAVPFIVVSGFLAYSFSFADAAVTQLVLGVSHGVFYVFAWFAQYRLSKTPDGIDTRVFALGRIVVELSTVLGYLIAREVFQGLQQQMVIVVVIAVMYTVFLIPKKPIYATFSNMNPAKEANPVDAKITQAASVLGSDYALTEREREIVGMLAQGWTVPQISKELFIEQSTVKTHVKRLYRKLGIHSKQELQQIIREYY